jgi:hypothetical protein
LHPTHGVRVLFERTAEEASRTTYAVKVYTPGSTFEGTAVIGGSGETPDLRFATEPPEDAVAVARTFLRTLVQRARKAEPPRRLLRWRAL